MLELYQATVNQLEDYFEYRYGYTDPAGIKEFVYEKLQELANGIKKHVTEKKGVLDV